MSHIETAPLNPVEKMGLLSLDERTRPDGEYCIPFAPIQDDARLSRDFVRAACRSLVDRKLVEFFTGLWTEDGAPAGSGYAITPAGAAEDHARADLSSVKLNTGGVSLENDSEGMTEDEIAAIEAAVRTSEKHSEARGCT